MSFPSGAVDGGFVFLAGSSAGFRFVGPPLLPSEVGSDWTNARGSVSVPAARVSTDDE